MDLREEAARTRFLKHVSYLKAWLSENMDQKSTALYRQVQAMFDKLFALNLRKNLFEVRSAGFWEGIGRAFEAPIDRLKRTGSVFGWELARRLRVYTDVMLK